MKYKVSGKTAGITKEVNKWLNQGWGLHGSIIYSHNFFQFNVKPDTSPLNKISQEKKILNKQSEVTL